MNNRFLRLLQLSLIILDFFTINVVYVTAEIVFRKQSLITPDVQYVYLVFVINISWMICAFLLNIYHEKNIVSFEQYTKVSVKAFVYFTLSIILCLFFFRFIAISRVFTLLLLSSLSISLLINRFAYLVIYHYFRKREWLVNKVVIIGYNTLSKKLVDYLTADGINKEIVGYCEEYQNVNELSRYPILSNIDDALNVCKKYGATEIYSTIAPEHNPNLYQLIQHADENCIRFKIVPDLEFFYKRQMHIDYLKEIPVISLRREPLEDLGNRIKKRLFDIVVSGLVVVFVLSWLIPLISLLIWIESRGPIFFRQQRTGKDNKVFTCLKFRSMRMNSRSHLDQATKNDRRITRLGRILRKTSLDEFPQFINVLKGDMSIVGPRPHMVKHTDEYSRLIGQYMVRQFLKPGITGWAQVNGFRGETRTVFQMQQRVEHDLWYMEHWSILLDLKIMAMTVMNVFKGEKNAF